MGNDTVENYAYRVFNKNKLGQKAADNGLLILIAKNDRKFRIEVGDGLTPIITDAFSSRIIRNIMTPEFKGGDFYSGVDLATTEIIKLIESPEYRDEFANKAAAEDEQENTILNVISAFFLTPAYFILLFFGFNSVASKTRLKKIKFKSLFKEHKNSLIISLLVIICLVTIFRTFFWLLLLGLFILGFLSMFFYVGVFIILKEVYSKTTTIYKGVLSGKLGFINFLFKLFSTLVLFFMGFMFAFMPVSTTILTVLHALFDSDLSNIFRNIEPYHVLFVFIAIVLLFYAVCCGIAIKKIRKSTKDSFGFSFFKSDKKFLRKLGGRRFSSIFQRLLFFGFF